MKNLRLLLLALLLLPGILSASKVITNEEIVITEPVEENTYLLGGKVNVLAPITGDLLLLGGQVDLSERVTEDVIVGAGELDISGVCGDDLRVLGGKIQITADVLGDLVITGGEIEVGPDVTIHGDVILLGGDVDIRGKVLGNMHVAAGELAFSGELLGDLEIKSGNTELNARINGTSTLVSGELKLGAGAKFAKDVRYYIREGDPDFGGHLQGSARAIMDETLKSDIMDVQWQKVARKGILFFRILQFLSGFVLTLILFLFFQPFFARTVKRVDGNVGGPLLSGGLFLVGLPIASVIVASTVIGLPLGIIGGAVYLIIAILASALAATVGAHEIVRRYGLEAGKWQTFWIAILLLIGLRLLGFLPIIGQIVQFILCAMAIGATYISLRQASDDASNNDQDGGQLSEPDSGMV